MPARDHETPFDNPSLTEGYPLDDNERSELKRAIEDLERPAPPADERAPASSSTSERPARATA